MKKTISFLIFILFIPAVAYCSAPIVASINNIAFYVVTADFTPPCTLSDIASTANGFSGTLVCSEYSYMFASDNGNGGVGGYLRHVPAFSTPVGFSYAYPSEARPDGLYQGVNYIRGYHNSDANCYKFALTYADSDVNYSDITTIPGYSSSSPVAPPDPLPDDACDWVNVDTDGDGICDRYDSFPNDPTRGSTYYIQSQYYKNGSQVGSAISATAAGDDMVYSGDTDTSDSDSPDSSGTSVILNVVPIQVQVPPCTCDQSSGVITPPVIQDNPDDTNSSLSLSNFTPGSSVVQLAPSSSAPAPIASGGGDVAAINDQMSTQLKAFSDSNASGLKALTANDAQTLNKLSQANESLRSIKSSLKSLATNSDNDANVQPGSIGAATYDSSLEAPDSDSMADSFNAIPTVSIPALSADGLTISGASSVLVIPLWGGHSVSVDFADYSAQFDFIGSIVVLIASISAVIIAFG